jgi:hypothetical protein
MITLTPLRKHVKVNISFYCYFRLLYYCPSRRVVTSMWWEGLVLPMIPRAMPVGA